MKPFSTICCACLTVALVAALFTAPAAATTITGVTINGASSFYPADGRTPAKSIDGSGLLGGLHNATASDMWLTDINLPSNDPWIIYDLGANYDLWSMHVWNYNRAYGVRRAAKDVDVYVASSVVSPVWTLASSLTFLDAPRTPGYAGATYPLVVKDVRLVKFEINSNWEGYLYPASGQPDYNAVTGLAEIRFEAVPEPGAMVLAGGAVLAGLAVCTLRRWSHRRK